MSTHNNNNNINNNLNILNQLFPLSFTQPISSLNSLTQQQHLMFNNNHNNHNSSNPLSQIPISPPIPSNLHIQTNPQVDSMILELFQIIQSQAKSLKNLYQKVDKMRERINQFAIKMKQMKKQQSIINGDSSIIRTNTQNSFGRQSVNSNFNNNNNPTLRSLRRQSQQNVLPTGRKSNNNMLNMNNNSFDSFEEHNMQMNLTIGNQAQHLSNLQNQPPLLTTQNLQNINSKTLIKILFGYNKSYQYKLQLSQPLDLPLYRQRNFSISLKLIDIQGKLMKNFNKIPLSLAIYSSQNPPKFIQKNTAGQKILKGYIQQSLHYGQCRFQKIQIKQVTSHFRNGWVFIVIIPCMTPLGSANTNNQNFVNYLNIQPLILEKIVVKAKKIKQGVNKKISGKDQKQEKEEKEESQFNGMQVEAEDNLNIQNSNVESKSKQRLKLKQQQQQDIYQDK